MTTYQHDCVFDCQMFCAPGDGTTPQGLAQAARRGSMSRQGRVHCLAVTGLMDATVRDATGSPARPSSCSSTMKMSVTCRLPSGCPATPQPKTPPPYVPDTSCLLLGLQMDGSSAEGFQMAKPRPSSGHFGCPYL
ncbi:hypothetical protein FQN60_009957 [Scomber scombrus]|uniref:Uncharacterized protein n=1 Tax=Scomber scombrus TaxID=13677 RepID=A0AAV1PZA8_SCOSC